MHSMEGSWPVDRRALLQRAMLLIGAVAVATPDTLLAATTAAQKRFFDTRQFAVLDEFAETMLPRTDTPGARDAGVAAFFDALMTNWAAPERRQKFSALLADIDKSAATSAGAPLAALQPEKKLAFVRQYDAAKLAAGDPVYRQFKDLIMTLYYLSEAGATEELRYELVPGKWDGSVPVTPDTRAWAV